MGVIVALCFICVKSVYLHMMILGLNVKTLDYFVIIVVVDVVVLVLIVVERLNYTFFTSNMAINYPFFNKLIADYLIP